MANQIADETSFAYWVTYTTKKNNIIISKVKTKYWRSTHKYGVRLPNNITEAMYIDQENGNTYWKDAIDKDTKKAKIDYEPIKYCTPKEVQKWRVNNMHGYQ